MGREKPDAAWDVQVTHTLTLGALVQLEQSQMCCMGGRNMKMGKHLDDHHQNRSSVYKLLVWQMEAGTAFLHGEMRMYCQT